MEYRLINKKPDIGLYILHVGKIIDLILKLYQLKLYYDLKKEDKRKYRDLDLK